MMTISMERYARQTILPELGQNGQALLQKARILCIGAGGLGSPALLYLAAAGIGTLGIVDNDTVEESNLQRQVLFKTKDISLPKAELAAGALRAFNPDIIVQTHPFRLTAENSLALFQDYDVILDGTDNFTAKYLINDTAVKLGLPVVYGAILGFSGQISVFFPPHGPCYRCIFPTPSDAVPNCAEAGVIGAVAGMMGSIQALEAIKLALGPDHCRRHNLQTLTGKFWSCDLKNLHTHIFSMARNPACPVCALPPHQITIQEIIMNSCDTSSALRAFYPAELKTLSGWDIIDVREQGEWDQGHMEGARLLPLSQLKDDQADLSFFDPDKNYLLYCQRGRRSQMAADILKQKGWINLAHLEGGYEAFKVQSGH